MTDQWGIDEPLITDFGQLVTSLSGKKKVNLNSYYHTIHIYTYNLIWIKVKCKKESFITFRIWENIFIKDFLNKIQKAQNTQGKANKFDIKLKNFCLKCIT